MINHIGFSQNKKNVHLNTAVMFDTIIRMFDSIIRMFDSILNNWYKLSRG